MGDEWRQRAEERIKELGKTLAGIAEEMKRPPSTLTKFLRGNRRAGIPPHEPTLTIFADFARAIGYTLDELYDGDNDIKTMFSIRSSVRTGDMVKAGNPTIADLGFLRDDLAFTRISGSDYEPVFRDGDVLGGTKQSADIDNLIGKECILELANGQQLIKRLAKGTPAGRYTLQSLLPAHRREDDMPNQIVKWAAPIRLILRE